MKTNIFFSTCLLWLAVLSLIGCKKGDSIIGDPTLPGTQASCRLTTFKNPKNASTFSYTYNAGGQLTRLRELTTGEDYTYSSDGYLTGVTYYNYGNLFSTKVVEYTNGRLAKITEKNASGEVIGTETPEYDGAGALTRYVIAQFSIGATASKISTDIYEFTNNKMTRYRRQDYAGRELGELYTFENGYVKEDKSYSNYNYTYDAQGRLTRKELKGSLYYEYEYTEGVEPKGQLFINLRKGFPEPIRSFPAAIRYGGNLLQYGSGKGLLSKETYSDYLDGSWGKRSEVMYTYSLNRSGFPLEESSTSRYYLLTGKDYTEPNGSRYYTYEGCL